MNTLKINHDVERYENIFNIYELENSNGNKYAFYNILNKVSFPDGLDEAIFEYYKVDSKMPLTTLSYNIYKTQHLWWLILVLNQIQNPVKHLEAGSYIKVIKKEYLDLIFDKIKQRI
jgi:hypothetical protein